MLLTVDIGNSSIDFGVFDTAGALICRTKLSAVKSKCRDEYAVLIKETLNLHKIEQNDIDSGIIASVVPTLTQVISDALALLFGITPLTVGPGIKTGLNMRVDNQTELGADIVANAVGASLHAKAPLVVIDMGTATTLTLMEHDREISGVVISPGIRISLDALSGVAAELSDISLSSPIRLFGKNTNDSMRSGVITGHALMLDGFIARTREETCLPITVIATGGLSKAVLPHMKERVEYIPDLTMEGLRALYIKNSK